MANWTTRISTHKDWFDQHFTTFSIVGWVTENYKIVCLKTVTNSGDHLTGRNHHISITLFCLKVARHHSLTIQQFTTFLNVPREGCAENGGPSQNFTETRELKNRCLEGRCFRLNHNSGLKVLLIPVGSMGNKSSELLSFALFSSLLDCIFGSSGLTRAG